MIVAVSDEPKATIEGFIKKHGVTYTFISSREAMKKYGISKYPTLYSVDPHGKLSSVPAQNVMTDCDVPPSADYSKKFDKARAAVRQGDYKTASSELAKLEKDTGTDGDNAKALQKWIDDHATKVIAEGDKLLEAGDVFGARDAWTDVSKRWSPKSEGVKAAKEKLAELQKDKDAKKALGQEKLYAQAQALEEAGDKANAAFAYDKCAKNAKDTKFADFCEKKAKELK